MTAEVGVKWSEYITHEPTVKQLALLISEQQEVLYGGAAGGGKSDGLLMSGLQYVDVPGYAGLLLRRTYPELSKADGLIPRSHEWLAGRNATWNEQKRSWTFPSGATLEFGHIQRSADVYQYHSAAYQFIGFDELTTFEETMYRYMFSRLRRLVNADVPIRMRAGSNPGGIGHQWVKERFIDPGSPQRLFIPATLDDNKYLDAESYERALAQLDPISRLQLRNGDWTARREGTMFQREWFEIVPEAPKGARRVRYWDLAATEKKPGKDPDWTVGALVSLSDGVWYVEDIKRLRATPGRVQGVVSAAAPNDGDHTAIRMEQEPGSSGLTVIDHYTRKVLVGYDFKGIKSTGDKLERARPFASAAEAGNVKLVSAPWNGAFIDEIEAVPFGAHDDQMDAVSGAMNAIRPKVGFADFESGQRQGSDDVSSDDSRLTEEASMAASGFTRAQRERLGRGPMAEVY